MDRSALTNDQAVAIAEDTVQKHLDHAVTMLDERFGSGYAAANPALVAECVHSQTLSYNALFLHSILCELGDTLEQTAGEVVAVLSKALGHPSA